MSEIVHKKYLGTDSSVNYEVIASADVTVTITLEDDPDPSYIGESVALTATLHTSDASVFSRTHCVHFYDSYSLDGYANVVDNVATLDHEFVDLGTHSYSANFIGYLNYLPATQTEDHTVTVVATQISMGHSKNPTYVTSVTNETFYITASITADNGNPDITGQIVFSYYDPIGETDVQIGAPVTLNENSALTTYVNDVSDQLALLGNITLKATFSATGDYGGSQGTLIHNFRSIPDMTLIASDNPIEAGVTETFTSSITFPDSIYTYTNTGDLTFSIDDVTQGESFTVSTNPYTNHIDRDNLSVATHTVKAFYTHNPSDNWHADNNITLSNVVVTKEVTSLALVSSTPGNVLALGDNVYFTATVTCADSSASGTITFYINSLEANTVDIDGDSATLYINFDPETGEYPSGIGTSDFTVYAVYNGDTTHLESTSNTVNETISSKIGTSIITVHSSTGSTHYGDNVNYRTTLTKSSSGDPITGTITVVVNGTTKATHTDVSDTSLIYTDQVISSTDPPGVYTIVVTYSGDSNYLGSTYSTDHTHNKKVMPMDLSIMQDGVTVSPWHLSSGFTYTIRDTCTYSSPSPTNNVSFSILNPSGSTEHNTAAIVAGVADVTYTFPQFGTFVITATYDDTYYTGTTSLNAIAKYYTEITVTPDITYPIVGQTVTFTGHVVATNYGSSVNGTANPPNVPITNGYGSTTVYINAPGTYSSTFTFIETTALWGCGPVTAYAYAQNVTTVLITQNYNTSVSVGQEITISAHTDIVTGASGSSFSLSTSHFGTGIAPNQFLSNVAYWIFTPLSAGTYTFYAYFLGYGSYSASSAPVSNTTVSQASAHVSINVRNTDTLATVSSIPYGNRIDTVISIAGNDDGSAYSQIDSSGFYSAALSGGSSAVPIEGWRFYGAPNTNIGGGSRTISYYYGGGTYFARNPASSYLTTGLTVTSVSPIFVSISYTIAPVIGQTYTYSMVIDGIADCYHPTGYCTVYVDSISYSNALLVLEAGSISGVRTTFSGLGTFSGTSPFISGTHTIYFVYSGDSNYTSISQSTTVEVSRATAAISYSLPTFYWNSVDSSGGYISVSGGSGIPTGTITFKTTSGSLYLNSQPLSSGSVSLDGISIIDGCIGTHSFDIIYSGNSIYNSITTTISAAVYCVTNLSITDSHIVYPMFGSPYYSITIYVSAYAPTSTPSPYIIPTGSISVSLPDGGTISWASGDSPSAGSRSTGLLVYDARPSNAGPTFRVSIEYNPGGSATAYMWRLVTLTLNK